jgi:DNA polymerase II small subunit
MRGKVVNLFSDESHLLDDRALAFLVAQADPMEVSRRVLEGVSCLEQVPLVLGLADVTAALEGGTSTVVIVPSGADDSPNVQRLPDNLDGGHKISTQSSIAGDRPIAPAHQVKRSPPLPAPRTHVTPSARRVDAECTINILQDITGDSTCSGCISDFTRYFQDRFLRLKRLIVNRREMMGSVPVAAIRNRGGDVKAIGMVTEKQTTSKGGVIFTIEDESGRIKVLSTGVKGTPTDIVTDEVVGVVGTTNPKRDLVYAEQIVRPEIPVRRTPHTTDRDLNVAFAADIHVGSNTFLDTQWNRFMDFLNGRLDNGNGTKKILETLEVLIIPGDVVDGIGVFPGQQEELLIDDIYRQYEACAELLKDVPDHIEIIMSPGNHDAVRLAEPQPSLPMDIQRMFAGDVRFVGNPALIDIEGVNILSYHGKSIDDFVTHVQTCTYEDPVTVMKEMLKRRHLAPIYGGRTNVAPEVNDHMVIETIPDIFVTGHVHGTGVERYRGTTLINASSWQDQTNFQKSMNFVPDPAKVPIVNLRDMSIKLMDFAT